MHHAVGTEMNKRSKAAISRGTLQCSNCGSTGLYILLCLTMMLLFSVIPLNWANVFKKDVKNRNIIRLVMNGIDMNKNW